LELPRQVTQIVERAFHRAASTRLLRQRLEGAQDKQKRQKNAPPNKPLASRRLAV